MKLTDLITHIKPLKFEGEEDQEITGIAFHSKEVQAGYVFVCIIGMKTDGHIYIDEAIRRGARTIVVEKWQDLPKNVTQVAVVNTRVALAKLSCVFFDNPTSKLKLIGVTGTNGKTTTTMFVESIFTAAGLTTGLLGTIEYKIKNRRLPVGRTTPESYDLQNIFNQMVDSGVKFAAMEVSSHAVDLHRVEACKFDTLVFTNLSQDHLDYHGSLKEYFEAKRKLFVDYAGGECIFIINIDDDHGKIIAEIPNPRSILFGLSEQAQVKALHIKLGDKKSHFILESDAGSVQINLKLLGLFNIYNALAAASVGLSSGLSLEVIKNGLEMVANVPGRFETIDCGQKFSVIVDYAHTPDGLEKVLVAAREITKGKLIVVFGCGGDRDRTKRPIMGKVAGNLSDYAIITSDNPRSEEPEAIIAEIEKGLKKVGSDYCINIDRKEAIYKAIAIAQENDCIILAGKGHETYQEFKDITIPFDDCAIAKEALKEHVKCSR